jgi:hypothetical protein
MQAVVLSAGALRVGFERRGDRFAHWIEVEPMPAKPSAAGKHATRWLQSIEGTASEPWPASPALQSLHVEQRGDEVQVALMVGMAGGSHWSMSVEANASRGELTFDVACRTREPAAFLGSSYQVVPPAAAARLDTACWRLASGNVELELVLDESAGAAQASAGAGLLAIVAVEGEHGGARTVRWRYRLRRAAALA